MARISGKPTAADRVAEYVDSPMMRRRVKIGRTACCTIRGRYGIYRTRITLTPARRCKDASCTCPSDYWPCKHAAALAETVLKKPESFIDVDKLMGDLGKKPAKDLLRLMRDMIAASPETLQALGVEGFEEESDEDNLE
ncbi:MAG: SWIM zinc finger family protein [Elusimicrobia bacterium]|nr:SWIM zinc finger family protein [Elusimicrobiota bacterium]